MVRDAVFWNENLKTSTNTQGEHQRGLTQGPKRGAFEMWIEYGGPNLQFSDSIPTGTAGNTSSLKLQIMGMMFMFNMFNICLIARNSFNICLIYV